MWDNNCIESEDFVVDDNDCGEIVWSLQIDSFKCIEHSWCLLYHRAICCFLQQMLFANHIAHSDVQHPVSGINFLFHFTSLVQISLFYFQPISLVMVHFHYHHSHSHYLSFLSSSIPAFLSYSAFCCRLLMPHQSDFDNLSDFLCLTVFVVLLLISLVLVVDIVW